MKRLISAGFMLRESCWVIVLSALIGAATAAYVTVARSHTYRSTIDLAFPASAGPRPIPESLAAATIAQIARTRSFAQVVAGAPPSRVNRSANSILRTTERAELGASDVIRITATGSDAVATRLLARTYAQRLDTYWRRLQAARLRRALASLHTRTSRLAATPDATAHSAAQQLREAAVQLQALLAITTDGGAELGPPSAPRPVAVGLVRPASLGAAAGLATGILLLSLRYRTRARSLKEPEIADSLGCPIIPLHRPLPLRQTNASDSPGPHLMTVPELIVSRLSPHRLGGRVVLMTSPRPQGGTTRTAIELARRLSVNCRVLLLELNLRRPELAAAIGLRGRPGVTSVALGHRKFEDCITVEMQPTQNGAAHVERPSLEVLLSGPPPPNAASFLSHPWLKKLMEQARARTDIVLIDAPSLEEHDDLQAIAPFADELLVVLSPAASQANVLAQTARRLEALPLHLLGVVLSD